MFKFNKQSKSISKLGFDQIKFGLTVLANIADAINIPRLKGAAQIAVQIVEVAEASLQIT